VHQLFSSRICDFHSSSGRYVIGVLLVNTVLMAFVFESIVERSKKCLDFAATILVWHVAGCTIYMGTFPTNWAFWVVQGFCTVALCLLSEFLCRKRELLEIPAPQQRGDKRVRRVSNIIEVV